MKLYVKLLLACMIYSWGLLAPMTIYAQSTTLRAKISFSAKNITVADALERLSKKVGLTFSYNPDQVISKRIVNLDFKNRMLLEVLDGILGPAQFRFQLTGKQVIIFKNKATHPLNSLENDPALRANSQADTVFIPVSSTVHDTLIVVDTIKEIDTVRVEVIKSIQPSKDDLNSKRLLEKEKVAYVFGVSISSLFPKTYYSSEGEFSNKLGEYQKHYSDMVLSGSFGLEASAVIKNVTVASGMLFTSFAQKLDYEYEISDGGYFRQDTLDKYYTVKELDTTWFYIVDSTYIPLDYKAYKYNINNYTRYLEIPLTLGYNWQYNKINFIARGGIIPGFFINARGQNIKIEDKGTIPVRDIEPRKIVLSYILSAGIKLPIDKKISLMTSFFYRSHLNSVHAKFPIKTRYSAFGINATLVYKIK